jgi:photosystem II stability/assembly factor-like uncharacterized protein
LKVSTNPIVWIFARTRPGIRTVLLSSLVFLFSNAFASAVSWTFLNSGVSTDLNSIYFLDASTGFAVGSSATLLKTTDGGTTWAGISNGAGVSLTDVKFAPSSTIGAAVGGTGVIVVSTNAGASVSLPVSGTVQNLFGLSLPDSSTFYAVGSNAVIRKSTDSGTTWRTGDPNLELSGFGYDLRSVYFVDASTGWVAGNSGGIVRTSDGGEHWTNLTMGTVTTQLNDVYFVNASTGWVVGDSGVLMKTVDSGRSWSQQISTTADFNSVHFFNADVGYVVGDAGVIYRSTDSGVNWVSEKSTTTSNLNKVFFISLGQGYAVGAGGTILTRSTGTSTSSTDSTPQGSLTAMDNLFDPTQGQSMTVQYSFKKGGVATVRIYTMQGRIVRTLVDNEDRASDTLYTVPWDGRNGSGEIVSSGVYLVHVNGPNFSASRKIVVVE